MCRQNVSMYVCPWSEPRYFYPNTSSGPSQGSSRAGYCAVGLAMNLWTCGRAPNTFTGKHPGVIQISGATLRSWLTSKLLMLCPLKKCYLSSLHSQIHDVRWALGLLNHKYSLVWFSIIYYLVLYISFVNINPCAAISESLT